MGQPIEITRLEHSALDLRTFAAKSRDGGQVRRLLALALVLEGASRAEAAERNGLDRQTLRDWVHQYNLSGVSCQRKAAILLAQNRNVPFVQS